VSEEKQAHPEEFADVQAKILAYKQRTGKSWPDIAQRIPGYSHNTISQFANGKYTGGGVSKLAVLVEEFLAKEEERQQYELVGDFFIEISTTKKVREALRMSHIRHKLVVVVGNPRLGKTKAIKRYAEEHSGVVLVESDVGYTPKILLAEIARGVDEPWVGQFNDMRETVIERLKDSEYFLIIDEAEHLPYKALEMIRRLRDKTGVGVVLIGQKQLLANLKGLRGQFRQLYGRVNLLAVLPDELRRDDVTAILSQMLPEKHVKQFANIFHADCKYSVQRIIDLVDNTLDLMRINNIDMSAEVIHEAKKRLIA